VSNIVAQVQEAIESIYELSMAKNLQAKEKNKPTFANFSVLEGWQKSKKVDKT
jgi:hypothetical protein